MGVFLPAMKRTSSLPDVVFGGAFAAWREPQPQEHEPVVAAAPPVYEVVPPEGGIAQYTADELELERQFDRLQAPLVSESIRPLNTHVHRYSRSVHEPEAEDFYYARFPKLKLWFYSTLFKLVAFGSVTLTIQTLFICALSVGATVFCFYFSLQTDLPLALLSVAVIFPITLGVSANLRQRKILVQDIAALKALALSFYTGARDWPEQSPQVRFKNKKEEHARSFLTK